MGETQNLSGGLNLESMSKLQEQAVLEAVRGGDEALKERLIQGAMNAVGELAEQAMSSEVPFEELFEEARAALIDAIAHFDEQSNERFISYYRRYARLRLEQLYRNSFWFDDVDLETAQLHDRFELALLELYPTNRYRESKKVHDEEYVADYMGVSIEALRAMKHKYAVSRIESLNQTVYLDDPLLQEDEREVDLVETLIDPATDDRAADYLDGLMDCLSENERYIICAKHGVLSTHERTDEQIAAGLGLSTGEVDRLYKGAFDKLKRSGARHKVTGSP